MTTDVVTPIDVPVAVAVAATDIYLTTANGPATGTVQRLAR